MDIAKDNDDDKKKSFWLVKNILLMAFWIKPLRNNDVTKWDNFDKIKTLSEKTNDLKQDLLDLTRTVSLDGKQRAYWEEKLRLVNQPETKVYEYFSNNKNEKRSDKVWRLQRVFFEQKN